LKVFGGPEPFDLSQFKLESYIRAGLGLETGTRVFIAPVPSQSPDGKKAAYPDLLISTIRPERWGSLWRFVVTLREEPGVVWKLLSVIQEIGNIAILESLTTETERSHDVYGILTLNSDWAAKTLGRSKSRRKKPEDVLGDALQTAVSEQKLDSPASAEDDSIIEGSIRLRPMERLHRAFEQRQEIQLEGSESEEIDRGMLKFTNGALLALLEEVDPDVRTRGEPKRVLIYADTEEKYISLHFPSPDQSLLRLSVRHKDEPGAIAEFARVLKDGGANILNSYSRLVHQEKEAEWRVVLDVSHGRGCSWIVSALFDLPRVHDVGSVRVSPATECHPNMLINFPQKFTVSSDISISKPFFGRSEELNRIKEGIAVENFLVRGFSRTGKTSLLAHAVKEVRPSSDAHLLEVTLSASSAEDAWWSLLRELANQLPKVGEDDLWNIIEDKLERANSIQMQAGEYGYRAARERAFSSAVREAFQSLLDHIRRKRGSVEVDDNDTGEPEIIIFLDQADLLFASDPEFDQFRATWAAMLSALKTIRWVVASAHDRPMEGRSTILLSKFSRLILGRLAPRYAIEFLEYSFAKHGGTPLMLHDDAYAEILKISGGIPVYLQALAQGVRKVVQNRPMQLDLVCTDDVDTAVPHALDVLADHFEDMYLALCQNFEDNSLRSNILELGEKCLLAEVTVDHGNREVEIYPGLIYRTDQNGRGHVSAVELLRRWSVWRGVVNQLARSKQEALGSYLAEMKKELKRKRIAGSDAEESASR